MKMPHVLSDPQERYRRERAIFDLVTAQACAAMAALGEPVGEAAITAWAERCCAIEDELGLPRAREALVAAEDDLITWAVDLMATRHCDRPEWQAARGALATLRTMPYRDRLIALCMKLTVEVSYAG